MLKRTPNPILAVSDENSVGVDALRFTLAPGVALAEREMASRPHVASDRRTPAQRHKFAVRDARQAMNAAESLGDLPGPRHAVHILVTGRFSLWDCVPAIFSKCGRIRFLRIATLGFSKANADSMGAMIDAGQVERLRLLCSHYFKGTSTPIYSHAVEVLGARAPAAEFLSVRTHAKLVLVELAGGRTLTLESSANLRSCKNLEQLTVFGSPEVHAFHAGWIDELFTHGENYVNCYTGEKGTARPVEVKPGDEVDS